MNLNQFKTQALAGGGARANLFEVEGQIGPNSDGGMLKFLCRSSSLPASSLGEISVPYRGRVLKIPGDRTFDPWDVTIISDSGFELRDRFEAWSNALNMHESNLTLAYQGNFISVPFFQDWHITWLKRDGARANGRTYRMVGCWPQTVSAIEVAADTNDSLAEFSVTMNYQWWMSDATT